MTIRLLLADDHKIVRRGLQVFLGTQPDLELVGEAATGEETIAMASALLPDIVLMDLNMPLVSGIEATRRIKLLHPQIKIIVLTSFSDQDHALPAIRAGARGYLLKDIEPDELVRAIKRVHGGQVELHPAIAGQLMDQLSEPVSDREQRKLSELTKRELEVLRLIAAGMSNRDIAGALHVTEKTVKTHVSHVLDKLQFTDRTQAAIYAVRQGLAD